MPGPGTRPAPGKRRLQLPRGGRRRSPRGLTRRRETAIIVAPALRLQEARAVLPLAEVPIVEPGDRKGAGSAWLSSSWNRRLLLPSAPHPPPPPRPGAHLPPTPHMRGGSRTAGQRKEAAREALGLLSTCPAARLPELGEAAAAAVGASRCSPPTAAAENQGGELGARERRNNFP